jgi:peptidoglycan/LPS O-acetylase OafA/YrhL
VTPSRETIGQALERTANRPSGFDYLRIGLSISVLVWHSFRVCYPGFTIDGWYRPFVGMILPMFFALSGFLVSGSLYRVRSIHEFLTLRAMRIVPALAVEITLSALILGPLLTTLPLGAYFSDPQVLHYFRNILGDIHFYLPGVFKTNPKDVVNLSLWTIPYELECYLLILVLWVIGAIRKRVGLLVLVTAAQLLIPLADHARGIELKMTMPVPGRVLVLAFAFGVALYVYRSRVHLSAWLAAAAALLGMVLVNFGPSSYYVGLPAAYLTIYLGLLNPRKWALLDKGDYSYGIYLYAFPIQQAYVALLPQGREWYINIPLTLVTTAAFAALSWHAVERPVLGRRKQIVGAVDRFAAPIQGLFARKPVVTDKPHAAE